MKVLPVIVVCSLLSSQIALAQDYRKAGVSLPMSEPQSEAPAMVIQDYRWQLMVADLSSVAAGMALKSGEVLAVGYFVAPGLHLAHGNVRRGLISAGLRGGLPLLGMSIGALIGESSCGGSEPECGTSGLWAGALVGVGTAMIVDWAVLGRINKRIEPRAGLTVAPAVAVGRDGAMSLGLSGAW